MLQPEVQMSLNVHELQDKKGTLGGGGARWQGAARASTMAFAWISEDLIDYSNAGERHGALGRGLRRERGLEDGEELRLH